MKNRFAEYYELPEKRIKEIWDNSLIVFDTNVLLNLYRYNEDARTEFINVIKFYKERLWIPYQVGLEFHRRREDIMRKNAKAYSVLAEKLSNELVGVVSSLEGEYARHPYISIKDIKKKVERCADSIAKSLEKQEKSHPDYSGGDEILQSITELFDGRVGNDTEEKELEALYKEGEKRYANQVPPGYCDEKKKKDKSKRSLYGDLIVWKQTIDYCKEQAKSVIFITDDHKQDWWDNVEGKHTPRKELIKEFSSATNQGIIIYDSSRFLEYAKRNTELKVSQKTIKEVEKTEARTSFATFQYPFSDIYNDFIPLLGDVDYYHDFQLPDYTSQLRKIYGNIIPPSLGEFKHFVNQMGGLDVVKQMTERLEQSRWWDRLPMMQTPSKDANNESNTTEQ